MFWILAVLVVVCTASAQLFPECAGRNKDYDSPMFVAKTWYLLKSTEATCISHCKTHYGVESDGVLNLTTAIWSPGSPKSREQLPLARIENGSQYLFSYGQGSEKRVGIHNVAYIEEKYYVDFSYDENVNDPSDIRSRIEIYGTDPYTSITFEPKGCGKDVSFDDCRAAMNCVEGEPKARRKFPVHQRKHK